MIKRILMTVFVVGLSVGIASTSDAGLFDNLKDNAKDRIKNKSKQNLENRVNQEVDKLIPSFENVEEMPFEHNVDLTPTEGEVAIYVRKGCRYSKDAIKFLKKNKIPFTKYDIYNNPVGKAHFKALNANGVPVILAGDERMNGYSSTNLRKMLKRVGIMAE